MVAKGEGLEEGWTGSLELAVQTIICRMDNNKVLLYSTGNYIQYPVINHNGKEYKKCIIYKTESLCHIAEINTTL